MLCYYRMCLCLVYAKRFSLLPVCSDMAFGMFTSIELLSNFRNVHSLFGTRRMQLDSLKWMGGLLCDFDLERPSGPVRPALISRPIKHSNIGPTWEPWDLLENTTDSLKSSVVKTQLCSPALLRRVLKAPLVPHFALAQLQQKLNWNLKASCVCVNGLLTDMLKHYVPAWIYELRQLLNISPFTTWSPHIVAESLTRPIRYGLPASPRRCDVKLWKATAVALRVGITTNCTQTGRNIGWKIHDIV